MKRPVYQNAIEAIRDGNDCAPCGIAYDKGGRDYYPEGCFTVRPSGWFVYDLKQGIEDITGAQPEFICIGRGRLPVPLTEDAADVLFSAIRSNL